MKTQIWISPSGRWRIVSDGKVANWEVRGGPSDKAWSAGRRVPTGIRDEFARSVAIRFVLPALAAKVKAIS